MQALSDPVAYGNLTAAQADQLRLQLSQAVSLTYTLTTTLDQATAGTLVNALDAIVATASTIDSALFEELLQLLQALAAESGAAASQFLNVLSAMLQLRGVGNSTTATALGTALEELTLSVLQDAVCGEAPSNLTANGLQLLAAFQSTYANVNVSLLDGQTLTFGDIGSFLSGSLLNDTQCKKSQIVNQVVPPFIASNTSHYKYGWELGLGDEGDMKGRGI